MPINNNINHIFEPNPLACGQAVLAMLTGQDVDKIIDMCGTSAETKLKDMKRIFDIYGISYSSERKIAMSKSDLPEFALLSLETPKCWHWSLYANEKFYDPEYGVLDDFPPSNRKYFWKLF